VTGEEQRRPFWLRVSCVTGWVRGRELFKEAEALRKGNENEAKREKGRVQGRERARKSPEAVQEVGTWRKKGKDGKKILTASRRQPTPCRGPFSASFSLRERVCVCASVCLLLALHRVRSPPALPAALLPLATPVPASVKGATSEWRLLSLTTLERERQGANQALLDCAPSNGASNR